MPAILDDPASPAQYRSSGTTLSRGPMSSLPLEIVPRQVILRDRVTAATLVPFSDPAQVPDSLLRHVCSMFNKEIEDGDTYPMINGLSVESFGSYWFANFGAIMLLGNATTVDDVLQTPREDPNWEKWCLGSFYIKPNYPGRSSHVCNGGFLVSPIARNRGIGRLMGEGYLEWAPKLGYTYSVFNLVYETNVASCRIWDALGFKRIGRVKGCGNLRSYPDQLVDAIIYGRDLGEEEGDSASEDRFDKIRFYLREGKYPNGSARAEKSRLRSAATHYKLVPADGHEPEKLMLKDKEVISDPGRQHEIAKKVHLQHHAGINKSTATIAERYHWVGIKGTVSQIIRNCGECRDVSKVTSHKVDHSTKANFYESKEGTRLNMQDSVLTTSSKEQSNVAQDLILRDTSAGLLTDSQTDFAFSDSLLVDPQLIQSTFAYQNRPLGPKPCHSHNNSGHINPKEESRSPYSMQGATFNGSREFDGQFMALSQETHDAFDHPHQTEIIEEAFDKGLSTSAA